LYSVNLVLLLKELLFYFVCRHVFKYGGTCSLSYDLRIVVERYQQDS
jgi:hypothetical protein